jgi:hypothetical protein
MTQAKIYASERRLISIWKSFWQFRVTVRIEYVKCLYNSLWNEYQNQRQGTMISQFPKTMFQKMWKEIRSVRQSVITFQIITYCLGFGFTFLVIQMFINRWTTSNCRQRNESFKSVYFPNHNPLETRVSKLLDY